MAQATKRTTTATAVKPEPKASVHERRLARILAELGPHGWQREYRFARPERQWRFDFALPELRLALEAEGGTWANGRHTRGSGFDEDCAKYNAAALRGWTVLRFTGRMLKDGTARQAIAAALAHRERQAA